MSLYFLSQIKKRKMFAQKKIESARLGISHQIERSKLSYAFLSAMRGNASGQTSLNQETLAESRRGWDRHAEISAPIRTRCSRL